MIKILIADDHPIIRHGLKQIITEESDMKISGEAESGTAIFELLKKNKYDILILDISLPDINGIEVLNKLKKTYPDLPVLILSAHPEDQYALRTIQAGAMGYLNKIAATEQLVNAIRKVISGGYYTSAALSDRLLSVLKENKKSVRHEDLSPREFEIMRLIASGITVKEIADKLFLSIPTVYTYRSRIYDKMKMKSDNEIIQYCIIEGLIL
jgi:two-component system, NarL family, invasion response regulator UvrY